MTLPSLRQNAPAASLRSGQRVVGALGRRKMGHEGEVSCASVAEPVFDGIQLCGFKAKPVHAGVDFDPDVREVRNVRLTPFNLVRLMNRWPQIELGC